MEEMWGKREKDVLSTIVMYIKDMKLPPTIREIGKRLNMSEYNVRHYLQSLSKKGYIRLPHAVPGKHRGARKIELVPEKIAAGRKIDADEYMKNEITLDFLCLPKEAEEILRLEGGKAKDYLEKRESVNRLPFDLMLCEGATHKDINKSLVKDFIEVVRKQRPQISTGDFLVDMIQMKKMSRESLGTPTPTNAAVLFFSDNPQRFIPQSKVRIAKYMGINRNEIIDSQEMTGHFPKIFDDVENFFRANIQLFIKRVGSKREDIYEYPFGVIREALVNAIAHRDYFYRSSYVQIEFFDDRIEVTSPGKLLPGLDITRLEGIHASRNEEICRIFYSMGFMEEYGTGVRRMYTWMKDYGLKPPVFSEPGDFFRVTFYGKKASTER